VVRAQLSGSEHNRISKRIRPSGPMGSSALVVAYPIMPIAIAPLPTALRIGPDRYRYDFTIIPGIVIAGWPVYRCYRGRESSSAVLHLYLKRSLDVWVSEGFQHEVTDVTDIARGGEPAFRAVGTVVIEEDWHEWQSYDRRSGAWSTPSSFWTKHL
jgi:hypothetical protein